MNINILIAVLGSWNRQRKDDSSCNNMKETATLETCA